MSQRVTHRTWEGREPVYAIIGPILVAFTRLLARIRLVGLEHVPRSGPVLIVANHHSHLDVLVLVDVLMRAGRRPRFTALNELWRIPVLGWLLRKGRMIRVHRGAGPERFVEEAVVALEADQAVVVYPEGRLVTPGELAPGRPGAGMLALRADAPVVPIAISGLDPYHGGLPRLRQRVTVRVGPPVELPDPQAGPSRDAGAEASEMMLRAIRAMLPR